MKRLVENFSPAAKAIKAGRIAMLPKSGSAHSTGISDGPLVVAGMFQTANGLGQAARSSLATLREHGYQPIAVDLSNMLHQVDAATSIRLDAMPRSSSGTLILHVNAPETRTALKLLGLRRWHNWRIIGYWAWELSEPPQDWLEIASHLSELWTPSDFITDTFGKWLNMPVHTVPISIHAPELASDPSSRKADLQVLCMADGRSSFYRKNLLAAVRMFKNAFDDGANAHLTIKLRNADEFPAFRTELSEIISGSMRATVIDGSIPHADRWKMISDHDVILSAHRAEGYGLHLAEGMALGKCAVATGWSGNTQFMNEANSVLLPFSMEPAHDPYGVYDPPMGSRWAKVNEDAGIEVLRQLYSGDISTDKLGAAAKQGINEMLGGDAMFSALLGPKQAR